ncbi:DUF3549 family protein [Vibrio rumoiensis]|uniref:DUF3549 domain-containing protein n=1 Tax=Vibrio rumoiensis 1S-45 TaxID=1188252 RepID=A0A1E5E0B1_9VIBR|nr:DUF3549 family protein [Vibrio rumoiensis]OEF23936.1 hypothetical protein A1QC_01945 [Vibrio rumoiensis 1S-45]
MNAIHNLSQLLEQSQCQFKIFDLGRRIQSIETKDFLQVEKGQKPYPYPLQRHAHLAVAYWTEANQPWIWFLKFPLDERGLLNQTDIGNFLKYVTEAMGAHLSQELSEEQQQHLANNPYTFKPNDEKMAVFHSVIRSQLSLPTSQYYEHAQHYFSGDLGWSNWQTVGLQGITDMCSRLSDQQNSVAIRKALPHLAKDKNTHPALYALLGALEHVSIADKLANRVLELADQECNSSEPDLFLIAAYVRALSGAQNNITNTLIERILADTQLSHAEVLIAIAGRCWSSLNTEARAGKFLLRLAQTQNQQLFNQLFADLVMIPDLRFTFLPLLNHTPSPELAHALFELQQQTKSTQ